MHKILYRWVITITPHCCKSYHCIHCENRQKTEPNGNLWCKVQSVDTHGEANDDDDHHHHYHHCHNKIL